MESLSINSSSTKTDSYYVAFERAARFLSRTGGSIAFATAQPQQLIDEICRQLKERLMQQDLLLAIVYLGVSADLSLAEQVSRKAQGAHAVVIANLGAVAATAPERLMELNFAREELIASGKPMLFFFLPDQTALISRYAADLYDQRTLATVVFEQPEGITLPQPEWQWLELHTELPDKKSLKLRTDLLKKHLAEAEALQFAPQKTARDIVLPLAEAYARLNLHQEAQQLIERYKNHLPPTATTCRTVANIARLANRYQDAVDCYQKALTYAKNAAEKADIENDLAAVYRHLGKYSEAKNLLEDALALTVRELGEHHPKAAELQNNLALVYEELGEYDKARNLLEAVLGSAEKNVGEYRPEVSVLRNNLAGVYQLLGNYTRAYELLEKALPDKRNFQTNEHLSVEAALSLSNLASMLETLGNYGEALLLAEKVYRVMLENLGKEHPNTSAAESLLNRIITAMRQNGWTIEPLQHLVAHAKNGNEKSAESKELASR